MGKLGKKYKLLLGEPCRGYYKHDNGDYSFNGMCYYVGNGYCVLSITDTFDSLQRGGAVILQKYDRYIPCRLWNKTYGQYIDVKGRRVFDDVKLNTPDYVLEDFNTENLVDYYDGHLDEFWWWHEIRKAVQVELEKTGQKLQGRE